MLIAVVGATGTGKSELSVELAQALGRRGRPAEIVNADAMQLYRGMDIGTAKLPLAARRGVPHHLLDVLEVTDEASVASYQSAALEAIDDIRSRDSTPILVGGSGLYVSSVLFDFRFPGTDATIRSGLEADLAESGVDDLFRRLKDVDPLAAAAIGPHNARRIVRALEVIELTGEPFGSGLPDESSFRVPTSVIGLASPRADLVARLDARVERMWLAGLLDEVGSLLPLGLDRGATASRAIGYAQAIAQLQTRMTREEAVGETKSLTRRYARRQVGWFRRYPSARWLDSADPQLIDTALAVASGAALPADPLP